MNSLPALAPKQRFPGFSGEWQVKKLGDLSRKKLSNGVFNDPTKVGRGYYLINVKDMYVDRFITTEGLTKIGIDKSEFDRNKVEYGDLFFTRSSLVKEGIAHTNLYLQNSNDITFDGHLIKMSPNPKLVDCVFLYYASKTDFIRRQLVSMGNTTTMTTIGQNEVSSVKISLPTNTEQGKIAEFLIVVDERIAAINKKMKLLQSYKQGAMQQIFTQQIRFKNSEQNYPDWQEKNLSELGSFKTSSVDKIIRPGEQQVRLVNYMNVYRHEEMSPRTITRMSVTSVNERQIIESNLKKGDMLFTPSSETPDDIGHSVVIQEDLSGAVFSYHLMRFRPKEELSLGFSHYFCNTRRVLSQIAKRCQGSTRFTITVGEFGKVKVVLPSSVEEQEKIANFLTAIDDKIKAEETKLEQAKLFKKSLLQRMFV